MTWCWPRRRRRCRRGLLAQLLAGRAAASGRRAPPAGPGAQKAAPRAGRPTGVRAGEPRAGARLNVVETLRAAAPWQPLRRRESGDQTAASQVRRDDFRITRFRQRTRTTTIFVVDASGSAALNRLAEAKGAVELLLADCYVRRDRVALLAFRGTGAELLLPPTRSLVRAKRSLSALPGGGGTPVAAGIDAALALADAIRRKGETPVAGHAHRWARQRRPRRRRPGRPRAEAEALAAARALRAGRAHRAAGRHLAPGRSSGQRLAAEMGALYLPLPYADADALSRAVRAVSPTAVGGTRAA